MKIVSGKLGGRTIESPKNPKTHPMSEKIRGAIFNMLGDVSGLNFIDAFAGTGAVGIEALSRGAKRTVFIEQDPKVGRILIGNVKRLEISNTAKIFIGSCNKWSQNNQRHRADIVFCDPPYDNPQPEEVVSIVSHVKPNGLAVVSWPAAVTPLKLTDFSIVREKKYGIATIFVYRQTPK